MTWQNVDPSVRGRTVVSRYYRFTHVRSDSFGETTMLMDNWWCYGKDIMLEQSSSCSALYFLLAVEHTHRQGLAWVNSIALNVFFKCPSSMRNTTFTNSSTASWGAYTAVCNWVMVLGCWSVCDYGTWLFTVGKIRVSLVDKIKRPRLGRLLCTTLQTTKTRWMVAVVRVGVSFSPCS